MRLIKTVDKQFYSVLGDEIKNKRKLKGLTQQDLAEQLGVTRQLVSQYEDGLVKIKKPMWEKICTVLDIYSGIKIEVKIGL